MFAATNTTVNGPFRHYGRYIAQKPDCWRLQPVSFSKLRPSGDEEQSCSTPVTGNPMTNRHLLELRFNLKAGFHHRRTARVEIAAIGWVCRAGQVSFQEDMLPLPLESRVGHGNCRQ